MIFHELISGGLSQRLKSTLKLKSETQSGSMKGKNIDENIRLIYDLMTQRIQKYTWLIIFIDFEKVFDLISWYFSLNNILFSLSSLHELRLQTIRLGNKPINPSLNKLCERYS